MNRNLHLIFKKVNEHLPPLTENVLKFSFVKDFIAEGIYPSRIDENTFISNELFFKMDQFVKNKYSRTIQELIEN